jgi:ElaB/YqjD/DUF883 family membrane-anchored ribosome-binding protein
MLITATLRRQASCLKLEANMRAESVIPTIEDLKTGASEVAELAKDLSAKVSRKIDTAYDEARRNARRLKVAAEDAVEETRHEIKEHPLTAVAFTALGAFAIGMVAGWFTGRRRS